jgi:D-amino-acid dehydrogenase
MAEVVILGGGVIGLCTAYYAALDGHRVTVVDRNPEQRDGCSFGNAGMIVPSHFVPLAAPGMVAMGLKWMWNPESPFYIKPRLNADLIAWGYQFWRSATAGHVERAGPVIRDLSFASRRAYEELAALPDMDFGLVRKGLLMLCKTQHALDDEARGATRARALGIPADILDAAQTAALDPDVTMDIVGSVYYPRDCHLSPDRLMAGLLRKLKGLGVRWHWSTEVEGWRTESGKVRSVRCSGGVGELTADEFVLAGGSWSTGIANGLELHLPMQAGKGYSLTLNKPRQLPRLCSIFTEARMAITPMGETLRFGGTMEIAGLNEDINPVRVRGIIKSVPKYFPEFQVSDFEGIQPWRGLRPCSPDGMPYLGRPARFHNLVVATGHAMMGLSLGPVTGQLVTELLAHKTPSIPLALMNPDRFA